MDKQLLEQRISEHEEWLSINPAVKNIKVFEPELFRALYLFKQNIGDVSIIRKDLSYACFYRCKLHLVNFSNTKLKGAIFIQCTINKCIFDYNEMSNAKIIECDVHDISYGV